MKRRAQQEARQMPAWVKPAMFAGSVASQWEQAEGSDTCPKESTWPTSDIVILVLCVIGIMGIFKMIYDIVHAYWELCVRQAAERLNSSVQSSAAERVHGPMLLGEGLPGYESDQCSLVPPQPPGVTSRARRSCVRSRGPQQPSGNCGEWADVHSLSSFNGSSIFPREDSIHKQWLASEDPLF